jgi:hypothetical protein
MGRQNPDRGANGAADQTAHSFRGLHTGPPIDTEKRWTRCSFPAKVGEMPMLNNRRERPLRSIFQILAGLADRICQFVYIFTGIRDVIHAGAFACTDRGWSCRHDETVNAAARSQCRILLLTPS